VRQIATHTRNYNHPLLLLKVGQIELTPQKIVVTGRWVAAVFAAGAVTALAMLAWALFGPTAAIATAAALMLNRQLFQLALFGSPSRI
jgi:hypothetical protein